MLVHSRGFAVYYDAIGPETEPAVLLLHGALGWGKDWFTSGVAQELASEFRVLVVDVLGGGRSDKPHEVRHYDERLLVEDFAAVLAAENTHRAAVWGYSWGAHLALTFASMRPAMVSALVLGGYDPSKGLASFRATLAPRLGALRSGGFDEYWRLAGWGPDARDWDGLEYNDPLAHAAMLEARSFVGDLGAVAAPTMLYVGAEDPSADGVVACAGEHGAELEVLPELDHAGAADAGQAVVAVVAPFLRGASTRRAS